MDKQTIIDYVMQSPQNSNPAVLGSLLDQYASSNAPSGTLDITANGTYDVSEYAEVEVSTKYPNDTINGIVSNFSSASLNIVYYDGTSLGEIKSDTMAPVEGNIPSVKGIYIPHKGSTLGMPFMKIQSSTPLSITEAGGGGGVGIATNSQVLPPVISSYTYCLYSQSNGPFLSIQIQDSN